MEDFTSYLGVQTSVQKARVLSSASTEGEEESRGSRLPT